MNLPNLPGLEPIDYEKETEKELDSYELLESSFAVCPSTLETYYNEWVETGWVGLLNLDLILSYAIEVGASDIHISSNQQIAFTILGDIVKQYKFEIPDRETMEDIVKGVLSNEASSIFQRDLEYDTSYEIRFGPYENRRFRVSVGRSFDANFLVFRTISDNIPSLEDLKIEEDILKWFNSSSGAVLVCGATGSGKAIHKNTKVVTPSGLIEVSDVVIGTELLDKDFNKTKVIGIHQAEVIDKFYKITFDNGEEVRATGRHDWLVYNQNNILVKVNTDYIYKENELDFLIPKVSKQDYIYKNKSRLDREKELNLLLEGHKLRENIYEIREENNLKEVASSLGYHISEYEQGYYYLNKEDKGSHKIVMIEEIEGDYRDYYCFEVDSLSHSYLITESFICTHNSTTMASILRDIQLKEQKKIITIEKPVEAIYPNDGKSMVIQRAIPEDCKTFDNGLTGAMRQNPDYILIGEVRNQTEVSEFLRAAETGHLAMSTIHTVNNVTTLNRIRSLFSGEEQRRILATLGDTLRGIVNQVLVKTKDGKKRFAVREILTIDYKIRKLIAEDKFSEIRKYQEENHLTMEHKLIEAYLSDKTTLEEARSKAPDQIYFDDLLEAYNRGDWSISERP